MPKHPLQANGGALPKFDCKQIMRDAWSIYRRQWVGCRPAHEAARKKSFAQALRNAWTWAKQAAIETQKTFSEKASDRVRELTAELMRIDARPWGMRSHRSSAARDAIQAQADHYAKLICPH